MPGPVQPPRRDVAGGGGVVQHDQPPAPAAAVPAQRLHRGPDRRGRVDQPPRDRERGVLLADPVGLLGVDPPHRVVVAGEPPRVLRRELGLAHPARAVQGVHHRPARALQPLPQPHQHPVAAGERLVRARHRPPHRRQHPRQPRPVLAGPRPTWPGKRWLAVRAAGWADRPQQLRTRLLPRPPCSAGAISGPSSAGAGVSSMRTGTRNPGRSFASRNAAVHSSAGPPRRLEVGLREQRQHAVARVEGGGHLRRRSCRRPASPSSPARR